MSTRVALLPLHARSGAPFVHAVVILDDATGEELARFGWDSDPAVPLYDARGVLSDEGWLEVGLLATREVD